MTDTRTPESYEEHHEHLLRAAAVEAPAVLFLIVALYAITDYITRGLSRPSVAFYSFELALPLVAAWLLRGPLRHRPEAVMLATDLGCTAGLVARLLVAPDVTVSGTAT